MRTRNRRVEIYFTDEEYNVLKKKVEQSGHTREGFCREALLNGIVKPRPTADLHELILQFRHIGNNINQMAVQAHTHHYFNTPHLDEQLNELWKLEQRISALFLED